MYGSEYTFMYQLKISTWKPVWLILTDNLSYPQSKPQSEVW